MSLIGKRSKKALAEPPHARADAEKLVRAMSDVLPGSFRFEYVPDRRRMWVDYTLWNGRPAKTEAVGWDERGPFLVGSMGERWEYMPSSTRPDGQLVQRRS